MAVTASKQTHEPLVAFENVALGYGRKTVIERLDLQIKRRDFIGIIGPNGSGKTTILRSILGHLKPKRGRVSRAPGLRFGYVVQRQALDTVFPLSVEEIVAMGRPTRPGFFGSYGRADREAIEKTLDIVGMREHRKALFRDLSGGQKQRTLIARALASEPEVLILDEPTNDLDLSSESRIMDIIHDIHHGNDITVIIVSHLLHVIINHVEKYVFIGNGNAIVHSIEEVIESDFLSKLYEVPISIDTVNGKRVIVMG